MILAKKGRSHHLYRSYINSGCFFPLNLLQPLLLDSLKPTEQAIPAPTVQNRDREYGRRSINGLLTQQMSWSGGTSGLAGCSQVAPPRNAPRRPSTVSHQQTYRDNQVDTSDCTTLRTNVSRPLIPHEVARTLSKYPKVPSRAFLISVI